MALNEGAGDLLGLPHAVGGEGARRDGFCLHVRSLMSNPGEVGSGGTDEERGVLIGRGGCLSVCGRAPSCSRPTCRACAVSAANRHMARCAGGESE